MCFARRRRRRRKKAGRPGTDDPPPWIARKRRPHLGSSTHMYGNVSYLCKKLLTQTLWSCQLWHSNLVQSTQGAPGDSAKSIGPKSSSVAVLDGDVARPGRSTCALRGGRRRPFPMPNNHHGRQDFGWMYGIVASYTYVPPGFRKK
jgi:hypothetical protein